MENERRRFGIKLIAANLAFQQIAIIVITMLISLLTVLGTKVEAITQSEWRAITNTSKYKKIVDDGQYAIYIPQGYYSNIDNNKIRLIGETPLYIVPSSYRNVKYKLDITGANYTQSIEISKNLDAYIYKPQKTVNLKIEEWVPGLNKWITINEYNITNAYDILGGICALMDPDRKIPQKMINNKAFIETDGKTYVYNGQIYKYEGFCLRFLNGCNTVIDFSYNNSSEWIIDGIKNPSKLTLGLNPDSYYSLIPSDVPGSRLDITVRGDNGIQKQFSIEITNGNYNGYKMEGNIERIQENISGHITDYKWNVSKNGNSRLKIQLNDGYAEPECMQIRDLAGGLNNVSWFQGSIKNESYYQIDISSRNTIKESVLELQVMDGNGKWTTKKIHVVPTDTNAVTNTINVPGEGNQSSESSQGGSYGDYEAESKPVPEFGKMSIEKSGNKITQTVQLYNTTEALCFLAPKKWRYIQNSYGYADYYDLYLSGKAGFPYNIVYNSPSSISLTYDVSKVPDDEYDFYVVAKNGTNEYFNALPWGEYKLGPSYGLKKPVFGDDAQKNWNEEHSNVEFILNNIKNTTEFKYKFYNMDIPAEKAEYERVFDNIHDITYDQFNGTKNTNISNGTAKFTLSYNSNYKEGNYNIIIMGKNSDSAIRHVVGKSVGRLEKAAPVIYGIEAHSVGAYGLERKEVRIITATNSLDPISELSYWVRKFDTKEEFDEANKQKPTKDELIQAYGEPIKYETDINTKPIIEQNGVGYYQIIAYAKNTANKETIYPSGPMYFGNAPEISYTIEGEPEGQLYSSTLNDNKTIKVKINDKENDDCTVEYFVSEQCIMNSDDPSTKLTINDFKDNKIITDKTQITKLENVKSGDEILITIENTPGKETDKYLYVLAKDTTGAYNILQTGTIKVDGTELELESIYVNDKIEENGNAKTIYGIGSDLEIHVMFNHPILNENLPDMYINSKHTRKQDSVEVDSNELIYHFIINENDPIFNLVNYIALEGTVKDTYTNQSALTFDGKNIDDEINAVINNYLIDAEPPKINNISILVSADEEMTYTDDQQNIFVAQCDEVKVKVVYDDDALTGQGKDLVLTKGNNKTITVPWDEQARTTENGKTVDIYTVPVEEINNDETLSEGILSVNSFVQNVDDEDLLKDTAGNVINTDINNCQIEYYLNDTKVENENLFFDTTIYAPEIYLGDNKIEETRARYATGSEFTLFAEFDNEENCADISGIAKTEVFVVYKEEESTPIVTDKNGLEIEATQTEYEKTTNLHYKIYSLENEMLPIKMKLDNIDVYQVTMQKQDHAGNTAQKREVLSINNKVLMSKATSGLNISDGEDKNFTTLSAEEKIYTLNLKLVDITSDEIKVHVNATAENLAGTIEPQESVEDNQIHYEGKKTINHVEYDQYTFTIPSTGKYQITVTDNSGEQNLLTEYIEFKNIYKYGDFNNDGTISVIDFNYLLRYLARFETQEDITRRIELAGDIDGDGEINILDAVLLARVVGEDQSVYRTANGYFDVRTQEEI